MFSCPSFHYTCPRTSFSTQGSYQVWCYYICINATFGNHSFLELYLLYCIDFCTTILVPSMFIMNNYLQTKICNHTFCHRGKSFQARVLRRMVEVGCETNSSSACFCATICWWIVTPITFAWGCKLILSMPIFRSWFPSNSCNASAIWVYWRWPLFFFLFFVFLYIF